MRKCHIEDKHGGETWKSVYRGSTNKLKSLGKCTRR